MNSPGRILKSFFSSVEKNYAFDRWRSHFGWIRLADSTEIEAILSGRPISALPSHLDDLSAITPVMMVFGSVADSLPPDVFIKADGCKRSWRKMQYLADVF